MKSTISELWDGNIVPAEQCGKNDSELEELAKLMLTKEEVTFVTSSFLSYPNIL